VVGDQNRIFSLLLTNLSYESFPEGIAGTSGFDFHDAEPDDDMGMGDPVDPDEKKFREKLKVLVNAIFRCLNQMKPSEAQEIESSKKQPVNALTLPEPDTDFPVFFADVSDSLRANQKRVVNDLQAKGVFVIDEKVPPPYDIEGHDQECTRLATSSTLSVHLFDQHAGREIENNQTYAMKQLQLCLEKSASQLIWVPESLKINEVEDKIYQDFLNGLEQLSVSNKAVELIHGKRDDIVFGVVEKIKKIRKLKQSLVERPSDQNAAVLLDTHEKDNHYAFDLVNFLSRPNITIRVNPTFDNPQNNFDRLEEHLQTANALILVCGNVKNDFIVARIMTIMSMIIETKAAITTRAIFFAPPKKADEIQDLKKILPREIHILDNSDQPQPKPEVLTPFVECIGCGGAS